MIKKKRNIQKQERWRIDNKVKNWLKEKKKDRKKERKNK